MIIRSIFFAGLLFLMLPLNAQPTILREIDSAIEKATLQQQDENSYVKTCFYIADEYMNIEQYDSAQLWLNKIHAILPVKSISL